MLLNISVAVIRFIHEFDPGILDWNCTETKTCF